LIIFIENCLLNTSNDQLVVRKPCVRRRSRKPASGVKIEFVAKFGCHIPREACWRQIQNSQSRFLFQDLPYEQTGLDSFAQPNLVGDQNSTQILALYDVLD